jgi:hypothetical protein
MSGNRTWGTAPSHRQKGIRVFSQQSDALFSQLEFFSRILLGAGQIRWFMGCDLKLGSTLAYPIDIDTELLGNFCIRHLAKTFFHRLGPARRRLLFYLQAQFSTANRNGTRRYPETTTDHRIAIGADGRIDLRSPIDLSVRA